MEPDGYSSWYEKIKGDIAGEMGWSGIGVGASEHGPSFTYSIGLQEKFDHPEIIIFGLNPEICMQFITMIIDEIKNGEPYATRTKLYDIAGGSLPAVLVPCTTKAKELYTIQATRYYDETNQTYEVLQMVWSDTQGKMPWEKGFEEKFKLKQPVLIDEHVDPIDKSHLTVVK